MMGEKMRGATELDKSAHRIMQCYEALTGENRVGVTRVDKWVAFYHEERLYSVYNAEDGTCTLLYADSPYKAIEKVIERRTVVK